MRSRVVRARNAKSARNRARCFGSVSSRGKLKAKRCSGDNAYRLSTDRDVILRRRGVYPAYAWPFLDDEGISGTSGGPWSIVEMGKIAARRNRAASKIYRSFYVPDYFYRILSPVVSNGLYNHGRRQGSHPHDRGLATRFPYPESRSPLPSFIRTAITAAFDHVPQKQADSVADVSRFRNVPTTGLHFRFLGTSLFALRPLDINLDLNREQPGSRSSKTTPLALILRRNPFTTRFERSRE